MSSSICVVLVEDSAAVRAYLREAIGRVRDVMVVGEAECGEDGLRLVERTQPDVIVLDIDMPRMDGVTFTERVMDTRPTPILLFCSRSDATSIQRSFRALEAGAMSLIEKPHLGAGPAATAQEVIDKIRVLAGVRPATRRQRAGGASGGPPPPPPPARFGRVDAILLGASTGGPAILAEILRAFPADLAAPVLVAQHMTPGFMGDLANWLHGETALTVRLARPGERPEPGTVYLAPDGQSLAVTSLGTLRCADEPRGQLLRPSVDLLFESASARYQSRVVGCVLSGMGRDGLEGARALFRAGGRTLVQDPASCAVDSMPQALIQAGIAGEVLAPAEIGPRLLTLAGAGR